MKFRIPKTSHEVATHKKRFATQKIQSVETFMITEMLSFSYSFYCGTLFFICFLFSSFLLLFLWSDFWSAFYKLPINRSALWNVYRDVALAPNYQFFRFPFCHWCTILNFADSFNMYVWSKKERQKWRWNWLLYYALSTVGNGQKEKCLDLEKTFLLGFFFFSRSMQKQFETKRNKKWFLK